MAAPFAGPPFFRFVRECDDFDVGEEAALVTFARRLGAADTLALHGYASSEGPAALNDDLGCARIQAAEATLSGAGVASGRIMARENHGATAGPAAERRSVAIRVTTPAAPEPRPTPKCGPDATDWFVRQVNAAIVDPRVLSIRRTLSRASTVGPSTLIAEAGATAAVGREMSRLGSSTPPLTGAITGQLAAGAASASAASAASAANLLGSAAAAALVGIAATDWKALVNHGAPYDFKAHTMNHPRTAHCPDDGCPPGEVGIVTLCPGSALPENCYESDLPGNLFYAMIGRFVGFSELTLQLGSQYAELTDPVRLPWHPAVTWDSPQDTAAISLGFALGAALPLTRAALCSAITAAHSSLIFRTGCDDCTEPTTAAIH